MKNNEDGLFVHNLSVNATLKDGKQEWLTKDISFHVPLGGKVALVGASGCGKTMTAMAILGLLPNNCNADGSVRFSGKDLISMSEREHRAYLGRSHVLLPQSGADFLNPVLTIGKQMKQSLRKNQIPRKGQERVLHELLARVGFMEPERVLDSYPFQLSGGMAQRVVMAIASIGTPELVIADEPTRGIDKDNTGLFLQNLSALFGKAAILLITHDLSVAAACDDILVMYAGQIVERGQAQQVLNEPACEYTKALLSALPYGKEANHA